MPRPRTYDETALLESAMNMFWAHGYEQTSISDLVAETGVNRASLYTAYPDKRALFLAAVRHYLDLVDREMLAELRTAKPASAAIRSFFLELATSPPRKINRGCLVTNTAVEFSDSDSEVATLVRNTFKRVEKLLTDRLKEAQADRHLQKGVEPVPYARQLLVLIQGLRVMARAGVSRPVLRDAVETALLPLKE